MPRRSRSTSTPKKSESKKSNKSHSKRASPSPSSSSSSSSSSSRSRSPPRSKRRRSASNGEKGNVKVEALKARAQSVKNEKARSRSPKREEKRAKSREGRENRDGKDRRKDGEKDSAREGAKEKGREGNNGRTEGVKRENKSERKAKPSDSPPTLGGRRWDDDSVKKEHEVGGAWGTDKDKEKSGANPVPKLKPDFAPSGALEEERHTVNGINLNYSEPPDARQPDAKWRLYVFKGEKQLDPLAIHRQSAYIVGRERKVAHLPIDHPSCSKQHSVIQFRVKRVTPATADEEAVTAIRPYIIDLNSTNGTILNGKKIDPAKYYELLEEDVLKFGHSTREYVLLKAETQAGPTTLD